MLNGNISGVVVSYEDLKTAPASVRAWILGESISEEDRKQHEEESHRPRPSEELEVFANPPIKKDVYEVAPTAKVVPQFDMNNFIEQAKAFMAENGAPAMLSLLRTIGVERVSQCTSEEAGIIMEGMNSYVSTR